MMIQGIVLCTLCGLCVRHNVYDLITLYNFLLVRRGSKAQRRGIFCVLIKLAQNIKYTHSHRFETL